MKVNKRELRVEKTKHKIFTGVILTSLANNFNCIKTSSYKESLLARHVLDSWCNVFL
jgi:hypothetical protein